MTFIHNEVAYEAAIRERIKANASKTRRANWLAEDPTRDGLVEWLRVTGYDRGGFLAKMANAYEEWGSLTEGQEAAVRRSRGDAEAKKAARAEQDAKSEFVGTVGQRATFANLQVLGVFENEGAYGTTYSCKFRDEAGNILMWRASSRPGIESGPTCAKYLPGGQAFVALEYGKVVTLKATVKSHWTTKAGVKMTILTRAKIEDMA